MRSSVVSQALLVVFALMLFWLFRYEIVAIDAGTSNGGSAYKLDRWTGHVTWLVSNKAIDVQPQVPAE